MRQRSQSASLPTSKPLTEREEEIVQALLDGNGTYATIATALGISERTVQTHLARIRKKLGCRNTLAIVLKMRSGS